jgi:hypothetical protein
MSSLIVLRWPEKGDAPARVTVQWNKDAPWSVTTILDGGAFSEKGYATREAALSAAKRRIAELKTGDLEDQRDAALQALREAKAALATIANQAASAATRPPALPGVHPESDARNWRALETFARECVAKAAAALEVRP